MDYDLSDSSGTDDDLPPSHQNNRFQRGGGPATGNGRSSTIGTGALSRVQNDMETQIHHIEQEAYCAVLRAFKAQADAITWEKEEFITHLRKELRVSDEEHRELLSRINGDDMIRRIREWRKAGGPGRGLLSTCKPVRDPPSSPSMPASRKKPRTTQTVASLPSPALHPSTKPSSSALRRGPPSVSKNKKLKSIPPEYIRWEGEDPRVSHKGGPLWQGRGPKKPVARGGNLGGLGRGRGTTKTHHPKKAFPPSQNGASKKASGDIEILHTETLIRELGKVLNTNHPDPAEIDKARRVLEEDEEALELAIARLEDASDGESADGVQERPWRPRPFEEVSSDGDKPGRE